MCHISPLLLFLGEGNPFCTFVLSSSHAFLYMGLGGQTALNTSPTKKEKKKERKRCLSLLFLSFSLPLSHKAWRQEWNGFHQSLNISKHKNLHNFGESFLYRLFLFRCSFVTDFSSRCWIPQKSFRIHGKTHLKCEKRGKGRREEIGRRKKKRRKWMRYRSSSPSYLLPPLPPQSWIHSPFFPRSGNESGFFILPFFFSPSGRKEKGERKLFISGFSSAQKWHLPKPLKCPWSKDIFWQFQRPFCEPMQRYTFLPNLNSGCIFLPGKKGQAKKSTHNTHTVEQKNEKAPDGRGVLLYFLSFSLPPPLPLQCMAWISKQSPFFCFCNFFCALEGKACVVPPLSFFPPPAAAFAYGKSWGGGGIYDLLPNIPRRQYSSRHHFTYPPLPQHSTAQKSLGWSIRSPLSPSSALEKTSRAHNPRFPVKWDSSTAFHLFDPLGSWGEGREGGIFSWSAKAAAKKNYGCCCCCSVYV